MPERVLPVEQEVYALQRGNGWLHNMHVAIIRHIVHERVLPVEQHVPALFQCNVRLHSVHVINSVRGVRELVQACRDAVQESGRTPSRPACGQITPGCARCNADFTCAECSGKLTLNGGACVGLLVAH